jgi:hypothetical protein
VIRSACSRIIIDWALKRGCGKESEISYSSKLVAAHIATKLIVEFRFKLRMVGTPDLGPTKMCVDITRFKDILLNINCSRFDRFFLSGLAKIKHIELPNTHGLLSKRSGTV